MTDEDVQQTEQFKHDRAVRSESHELPSGWAGALCRILPHDYGFVNTYEEFDADETLVHSKGAYCCTRCGHSPQMIPTDDADEVIILD